jgi:hypothetical protein
VLCCVLPCCAALCCVCACVAQACSVQQAAQAARPHLGVNHLDRLLDPSVALFLPSLHLTPCPCVSPCCCLQWQDHGTAGGAVQPPRLRPPHPRHRRHLLKAQQPPGPLPHNTSQARCQPRTEPCCQPRVQQDSKPRVQPRSQPSSQPCCILVNTAAVIHGGPENCRTVTRRKGT